MKSKVIAVFSIIFTGFLFSGCSNSISNLTAQKLPQNPSGIYSIAMNTNLHDRDMIPDSVTPRIVIDGEMHKMQKSNVAKNIYEYNYKMPLDQSSARYYFVVNYETKTTTAVVNKEVISDIYDLEISNRYIINLESERGFVGSKIPVVGRGFSEFDQVVIGGVHAETQFISRNLIQFTVPLLNPDRSYDVKLVSGNGDMHIGSFYVDPSAIHLNKSSVELEPKKRTVLVFHIDFEAPAGGFPIDVFTNIPESVIMPEVVIPQGARTVGVTIEGGEKPGCGDLFISAPGFEETSIPIAVGQGISDVKAFPAQAKEVAPEVDYTTLVPEMESDPTFSSWE